MSSTGRIAGKRLALDRYMTPDELARALVHQLHPAMEPRVVLEPHVGGGAWLRAAREAWPSAYLLANDLDPEAPGLELGDEATIRDWSEWSGPVPDLILGNPPFRVAEQHTRRALEVTGRHVVFLVRQGFLASRKRLALWQEHQPRAVIVLAERPSFTGGGTDSADYCMVWWDKRYQGTPTLHWLSWRGA